METAVGIFSSPEPAQRAFQALRAAGISSDRLTLLTPGASERAVHGVPTTDTEQPGMGKAVGGVVGGVVGATTGLGLAEAAASLLIPGVGPVAAIGLAAAALLGAGGAVAGAAAGDALEDRLFRGLPKDEIYIYEDALRHGHSVLVAFARDEEQRDAVRATLEAEGAETVDAARERWWVGLREAEEAEYEGAKGDFRSVEQSFRAGFEAALRAGRPGRPWDDAAADLRREHGEAPQQAAFRRGYERGLAYGERVRRVAAPVSGR
jgi:hypothetical protein